MEHCKVCESPILENDTNCSTCHFPLSGTSHEQAVFVGKQVLHKSAVIDALKKLKYARLALYLDGAWTIGILFLPWNLEISELDVIVNALFGALFFAFGYFIFRFPRVSLLVPAAINLLFLTATIIAEPASIFGGIYTTFAMVLILLFVYRALIKAKKNLRKNPYLANQIDIQNNFLSD